MCWCQYIYVLCVYIVVYIYVIHYILYSVQGFVLWAVVCLLVFLQAVGFCSFVLWAVGCCVFCGLQVVVGFLLQAVGFCKLLVVGCGFLLLACVFCQGGVVGPQVLPRLCGAVGKYVGVRLGVCLCDFSLPYYQYCVHISLSIYVYIYCHAYCYDLLCFWPTNPP